MHNPQAETRFVELMTKLFQLDEAEALDFGIYRVIRRHNKEVRDFLGEIINKGGEKKLEGGTLSSLLESAFTATDHEVIEEAKERKAELESQLGINAKQSHDERERILTGHSKVPALKVMVQEYRDTIDTLQAQQTGGIDRTEVLNHLYNFFARHYQDGDFIVERRFNKDGSRYIQSRGGDTEFHWATEDMYYIKSGDTFTDYPVTISNGEKLVFTVEPDTLNDTRASLKPTDKTHYEISRVEKQKDGSHSVTLSYLKGAQSDKQKSDIAAAVCQKVKADAAEVKRWLNHFIARNQSDFFIHKKLKEALTSDLDIFIKTDVLNTDQLLKLNDLPRRAIQVGRITKQVGLQIIDFLATLEDFQKQLWEKKKLVFKTRYVVTLDRIAKLAGEAWLEQQLPTIIKAQKAEWKSLGLDDFKESADCKEILPGDLTSEPKTRWLPLPVDTGLLDDDFKWKLLAAVTQGAPLDESLDGVAIHSDNWQAVNSLEEKYRFKINSIYADPPYNTDAGPISYKNGYKRSSWAALMDDRINKLSTLMKHDAVACFTIDDFQKSELKTLLEHHFGEDNLLGTVCIKNSPSGRPSVKGFRVNHEYALFVAKSLSAEIGLLERSDLQKKHFSEVDERGVYAWENFRKRGGATTHKSARPRQFYPIYIKGSELRIPDFEWDKSLEEWKVLEKPSSEEKVIFPVNDDGTKRVWSWGHETALKNIRDLEVRYDKDQRPAVYRKSRPVSEGALPSSFWMKKEYSAVEHGSVLLKNMFNTRDFAFPKSIFAVEDCLRITGASDNAIILDIFGGSGTTAHAVIYMNSQDYGNRKFIIVEANNYIHTFTIPRIIKAACASKWNNSKPEKLNGIGLFIKIHEFEQYEDTLENLDTELSQKGAFDFGDPAFSLRYRIKRESKAVYCAIDSYRSPWGYLLKRALGGGEAHSQPVDLVESLIYLLGLNVNQLYREEEGVVITGHDRRGRSVAVFFRECDHKDSEAWVSNKLAAHNAQLLYTNLPAELSCEGSDRLHAIEAVFASQFGRREL